MENKQMFTILVVAMLGLAGITAATTYTLNNNTNDVKNDLNDTILRLNEAEKYIADLTIQIEDANNRLAELTTIANQAVNDANTAIAEARNAQALADAAELAANNALAAANAAGTNATEAWNAADSALLAASLARANAISAWAEAENAIEKSKVAEAEVAEMQTIVNLNKLMQSAETISTVTMSERNIPVNAMSYGNLAVGTSVGSSKIATAAADTYTSALKAYNVALFIDENESNDLYELTTDAMQLYRDGSAKLKLQANDYMTVASDKKLALVDAVGMRFAAVTTNYVYDNALAAAKAFLGCYDAFTTIGNTDMANMSLIGAAKAYILIGANTYNSNDSDGSSFDNALSALKRLDTKRITDNKLLVTYYQMLGTTYYGLGEMEDSCEAFAMAEKTALEYQISTKVVMEDATSELKEKMIVDEFMDGEDAMKERLMEVEDEDGDYFKK